MPPNLAALTPAPIGPDERDTVPNLTLTDPQVLALARYLQRQGFTTGLPLDSRDPLANGAQTIMDSARGVIHRETVKRRQQPTGRTLQACGADTSDGGICTLLAGHGSDEPHRQIGGDK